MSRKKKGVTVETLKNAPAGAMLACLCCGGEYSATAGDYFWKDPNEIFTCCDEPMLLVRKVVRYASVCALRARHRKRGTMTTQASWVRPVVHILEKGRMLCGQFADAPHTWPAGHGQVSARYLPVSRADLAKLATCSRCIERASSSPVGRYAIQTEGETSLTSRRKKTQRRPSSPSSKRSELRNFPLEQQPVDMQPIKLQLSRTYGTTSRTRGTRKG